MGVHRTRCGEGGGSRTRGGTGGGRRVKGRGEWGRGCCRGIPPPENRPPLPQWLAKALGSATSNFHKASLVTWSAQVLDQGCSPDHPVFVGAGHSHMPLLKIFRSLVRKLVRKHGTRRGVGAGQRTGAGLCTTPPPRRSMRGAQGPGTHA